MKVSYEYGEQQGEKMKASTERYMSSDLVDMLGRSFNVGDIVARAISAGTKDTHEIELRRITRIENGKLFMSNSSNPMKYPGRLLIVTPAVSPEVMADE